MEFLAPSCEGEHAVSAFVSGLFYLKSPSSTHCENDAILEQSPQVTEQCTHGSPSFRLAQRPLSPISTQREMAVLTQEAKVSLGITKGYGIHHAELLCIQELYCLRDQVSLLLKNQLNSEFLKLGMVGCWADAKTWQTNPPPTSVKIPYGYQF